ncbi:MAG: tRNA (adenosine(37)-N6)-threonylcarbamoyltransferase complex dimerization subunit type 1 TsaB [Eubacteriales bacterium]|nr:tRNA (adenosine(37)-N6)-threonylcarbamoyltransferase complex dimerization subunit type 1 TsaB [Eubacteriales bacterium]
MRILATDTTGKSLAIALVEDGRLIGEIRLNNGYNHAITHLPQIENLLKSCSTTYEAIDLFACTRGPGSYTGTRIGLSTIKAMAYAAQKPAIGVSTLETLAWPWRHVPQTILCPLLDARNGRVFAAAFRAVGDHHSENQLTTIVPPGNYLATDFYAQLSEKVAGAGLISHPIWLTGDGADSFLIHNEITPNASIIRLDRIFDAPNAAMIANIALLNYQAGDCGDPFSLAADYLSPAAAERLKADKSK